MKKTSLYQNGFTLLELLISITILGLVLASTTTFFFQSSKQAADQKLILDAHNNAQAVLTFMKNELSATAAGMPIGQAAFMPTTNGIGDAALAILSSSTENRIHFRYNRSGFIQVVQTDFSPHPSRLTASVYDPGAIRRGDTVYFNNFTVGQTGGMRATVENVSGSEITIERSYISSAGAQFPAGSSVTVIEDVTYDGSAVAGGIRRIANGETVILSPDSRFTVSYHDSFGNELSLPLTPAAIQNALAFLRVTVMVAGRRRLSSGEDYQNTSTLSIALRNMRFYR